MASLDTNLLLRLMLDDVPHQTIAIKALCRRSAPKSLVVEDVVFFECVWVLSMPPYSLDRETIAGLLRQLVAISALRCNRDLVERAVGLYVRYRSISFIDAALAAYAELRGGTPLLTYDKKLAKHLPDIVSTDVSGV